MRFVSNGKRDTHSQLANHNPRHRRDEDQPIYPSAPLGAFNPRAQARPTNNIYTGSQVTGVALLHKQGYTPTTADGPTNNDPKRGI